MVKALFKISGSVSLPVLLFGSLLGMALLGVSLYRAMPVYLSDVLKSNLLAQVSTTTTSATYQCPNHTNWDMGLGSWTRCQGQISTESTCQSYSQYWWDPPTYTFTDKCTPITAPVPAPAPAPATIKVLSPNGGETWAVGKAYPVSWQASDPTVPIVVYLYGFDEFGGTYIAQTVVLPGFIGSSVSWLILPTVKAGKYLIKVVANPTDNVKLVEDSSDAPFTITAPNLPDLTVIKFSVYRIDSANVGMDYCIKNVGNAATGNFYLKFSNQDNPSWDFGGAGFNPLAIGEEYCGKESRGGVWSNGGNGYVSGDNKIIIFVDSNNIVQESNENNNQTAYVFNTIIAPTVPTEPKLTISISPNTPVGTTIIAGSHQVEFTRYLLDAAASSEDLVLTSLPLDYGVEKGSATDLTNCELYDGSTALNTGNNVVNPTSGQEINFTLDGKGLIITKGYSKQLSLKCDVRATASGIYSWAYNSNPFVVVPVVTGLTSGQKAVIITSGGSGYAMTVASAGTLSVSLDSVAPYQIVVPGNTVELARIRFTGTGEEVAVKQVTLKLSSPELNTPVDLVSQIVTLWLGSTQVGSATFSSGDNAISSALTGFIVPKDGFAVLTVRGTIAGISTSGPLTKSGDLLKVDYDGNNTGISGTYGVGQSSGQTIIPSGSDTNFTGVRIMKSYPILAAVPLSTSARTLFSGDGRTLYRFSVKASDSGKVALHKLTFKVSSPTVSLSKFELYAFNDSGYSVPAATGTTTPGLVTDPHCANLDPFTQKLNVYTSLDSSCYANELSIPSGTTRWLELRASVGTLVPSGTSQQITIQLEGDAAYPLQGKMDISAAIDSPDINPDNDFIWSPVSTSLQLAPSSFEADWTNGYGVPGLPSTNMAAETLTASVLTTTVTYQCPNHTNWDMGPGSWTRCQGQISTESTCQSYSQYWWDPPTYTFTDKCTPITSSLSSQSSQLSPTTSTKTTLLSTLDTSLSDGVISSSEKQSLLSALNTYLQ